MVGVPPGDRSRWRDGPLPRNGAESPWTLAVLWSFSKSGSEDYLVRELGWAGLLGGTHWRGGIRGLLVGQCGQGRPADLLVEINVLII